VWGPRCGKGCSGLHSQLLLPLMLCISCCSVSERALLPLRLLLLRERGIEWDAALSKGRHRMKSLLSSLPCMQSEDVGGLYHLLFRAGCTCAGTWC
jgi:hypothetical protein